MVYNNKGTKRNVKKIKELEKRINPEARKPNRKNKDDMGKVFENAKQLYETRNYIINAIKGEEETKEVNLDWLREQNMFKELVKDAESNIDLRVSFGKKRMKKVAKVI